MHDTDPIGITGARSALAAVPYILGFHPAECIVVLGVRDGYLAHASYGDLALYDTTDRVAALVEHHDRLEPDAVVVIGYGAAPQHAVRTTAAAFVLCGTTVLVAIAACRDRYYTYHCVDPRCCPPDGTPYDLAPDPVAVAYVVAGHTALPTLEALLQHLQWADAGPDADPQEGPGASRAT